MTENLPTYNLYTPLYAPIVQHTPAAKSDTEDEYQKYLRQLAEESKTKASATAKEIELEQFKLENKELIDTIHAQLNDTIRSSQNFKKSIKVKDNKCIYDTGVKGSGRWGGNFLSTLKNIGKSLIGYGEDGKWSFGKLLGNLVTIGIGVGICCIPGGAYALAAYGAIAGGIGICKGYMDLNETEKSGNQEEIDRAQQAICGSGLMAATSVLGTGVLGRIFRTGSATASRASAAATRTSYAGRAVSRVSNFGRDITKNAYRGFREEIEAARANGGMWQATKNNFNNAILKRFSFGRKRYKYDYDNFKSNLSSKLDDVNAKLAVETDPVEKALLQDRKMFLEENMGDFNSIGSEIKTKAQFDELSKGNMSHYNREYINGAYTKNTNGDYIINGVAVKPKRFIKFQREILREQKAICDELNNVIKSKENMMRRLAYNSEANEAELSEYVSIDGVKRSIWKPSTWCKSDYQLAIGGKNPSFFWKSAATVLTNPSLNLAKTSAIMAFPIYSDPTFITQEMLPEQIQQIIQQMQGYIDAKRQIVEAIDNATTIEEYQQALLTNQRFEQSMQQQATGAQGTDAAPQSDAVQLDQQQLQQLQLLQQLQQQQQQQDPTQHQLGTA